MTIICVDHSVLLTNLGFSQYCLVLTDFFSFNVTHILVYIGVSLSQSHVTKCSLMGSLYQRPNEISIHFFIGKKTMAMTKDKAFIKVFNFLICFMQY